MLGSWVGEVGLGWDRSIGREFCVRFRLRLLPPFFFDFRHVVNDACPWTDMQWIGLGWDK